MQPYQEAGEEIIRKGEEPAKKLKSVGNLALVAGSLGGGAGVALRRLAPFFSKHVPQALALKGISKINPQIGKFIKTSEEQGHSASDIFSFMQGKIEDAQTTLMPKKEEQKVEKNIIEKTAPNLHLFIKEMLGRGERTLPEIAKKAFNLGDKTIGIIKKLEKDTGKKWEDLLESIYGAGKSKAALQEPSIQGDQGGAGMQKLMALLQQRAKK